MTTLYEWQCPTCGKTAWCRGKPPKPHAFVYRAWVCKACGRVAKPTGQTRKHYSLKELL